jgi:proteasome assembly chaperone (PAC2) family protein
VLDVQTWPELQDPVLAVAFSGWVDAGMAGAQAIGILREQLGAVRTFAHIDLADLVDLQQTRPIVEIVNGISRRVSWPRIECIAGRAGRDTVLVVGPEPSLRWPSVVEALVGAAQRLGVVGAFGLAAMPAVFSHRRPIPVMATATSPELADAAGALRADYVGITGLQTALLFELGRAGIPSIGLWAQVPHYLAGNPSPPAARAVLAKLVELTGIELDLADLDRAADRYTRKVEAGLAERPDVAELVKAIEAQDGLPPIAEDLVTEIERYLRSRPDED